MFIAVRLLDGASTLHRKPRPPPGGQCRARTLTIIRRDYIIIIHKIIGRQSSINIIMHNIQGGNWGREFGEEGQERPTVAVSGHFTSIAFPLHYHFTSTSTSIQLRIHFASTSHPLRIHSSTSHPLQFHRY